MVVEREVGRALTHQKEEKRTKDRKKLAEGSQDGDYREQSLDAEQQEGTKRGSHSLLLSFAKKFDGYGTHQEASR